VPCEKNALIRIPVLHIQIPEHGDMEVRARDLPATSLPFTMMPQIVNALMQKQLLFCYDSFVRDVHQGV